MSEMEVTGSEIENDAPPIQPPAGGSAPLGKKVKGPVARVVTETQTKEARAIVDWLREIGTAGKQMQLQLYRTSPKQYMGEDIAGFIRRFDEEIDEEQIQRMFGGGKYQIKLNLADDKGVFRFATAHSFEISGPPKIVEEPTVQSIRGRQPQGEDPSVVKEVLATMSKQLDKAEDRARTGSNGMDADAITRAVTAATVPFQSTIALLTAQLAEAQKAANEARIAPPDPVRDKMLEKVFSDDSSRMESLRMAHQSEVSTLRQEMANLETRLRDKHERELVEIRSDHKSERDRSERLHDQQVAELKRSSDREIADLKRSYETQIQILRDAHSRELTSLGTTNTVTSKLSDGEVARLRGELAEAKAELKSLREKKDKSIFEQAKEMDEIKELFGAGDGEEKKGWERAIEAVGNLPAIQKVIGKIAGADQGQQPGQMPPPHTPFVGQDGQTYVHDGQGHFQIIQSAARQKRLRQQQRPQRPQAPPPPPPPPANATPEQVQQHQQATEQHAQAVREVQIQEAVQQIDPALVAQAVQYMEQAYNNKIEPKICASSVRSSALLPASILNFLRAESVDVLLERVARLEPSSPFKTQAGINWIRKVAKELV